MRSLENDLIIQFLSQIPEKSTDELEKLSDAEVQEVVSGLPTVFICEVINRLKPIRASRLLTSLPEASFKNVYSILDPVRAAHLMLQAEQEIRNEKILLLSEFEQKDLAELLSYPPGSAGSIMDTSLITCRTGDTVEIVLRNLRKQKSQAREVFVTDLYGKLVGYLPLQELLFAEETVHIEKLMRQSAPFVNALSPKSEVTETFEDFRTAVLPVTHIDGSLLGAIRYSSLVSDMQDKALSAMASMVGASPSERALSLPFYSFKKRLPWLLINLVTAFVASAVVGLFQGTIAQVTALAVLLPIVAGQSGNTGAQAMAVTMRGLALREVRPRQWAKVLFKELRVGFMNGVIISIVTGAAVYFWSGNLPLGGVMTAAMTLSMIVASLSGASIPIILTSLGKDPAQSSSVILTTVTDVIGFLSFLGLATLFVSLLV